MRLLDLRAGVVTAAIEVLAASVRLTPDEAGEVLIPVFDDLFLLVLPVMLSLAIGYLFDEL